jgi:iron(III) transport system permease protein
MSVDIKVSAVVAAAVGRPRLTAWDKAAFAVAAVVLTPLFFLVWTAFGAGVDTLAFMARHTLTRVFLETGSLISGVLALSLVTGVTTGWLVATYRFPGRDMLGWLLILPFAVPTYIAAYAYVDALDFFGPFQSALRQVTGFRSRADYWFPEIRSAGGAVFVTSMVLYPYIYVASRAAFAMQGGNISDAARSLGCTRLQALRRAILPAVWPALAAGGTLVMLETLNDIGASQYLGVETFTVAIFNTWLSRGNLPGAAQIALLALAVIMAFLWLERRMRGNQRFILSSRNYRAVTAPRLTGWRAGAAFLLCALPVLAGFVLPAVVLLRAAWRQMAEDGVSTELVQATLNTVFVASVATLAILALAMLITFAQRFARNGLTGKATRISTMGYAVPGTVLVIGLLPALGLIDRSINDLALALGGSRVGLVVSGSVIAVMLAYTLRFLAIGVEQIQGGLGSLSRNTDFAAQSLGCPQPRLAWTILTPALRPALAGAAILIFVDCLKELPATLLLRPLNFETLATHLYGHAARGSFEDGAPAALLIVAAGLLPLASMHRLMEDKRR